MSNVVVIKVCFINPLFLEYYAIYTYVCSVALDIHMSILSI